MSVIQMVTRRGVTPLQDGRERFLMFPVWKRDRVFVYAFGLKNGRTKIGIAARPRERINQHWVVHDCCITWAHAFGSHPRDVARRIERAALQRASFLGERIRRTEYFTGLSRDDALHCVRHAMREV